MPISDLIQAALALVPPAVFDADALRADRHRRELLALSDRLLGEVEELRMAGEHQLPPLLRLRLKGLLAEMGRAQAPGPLSVRAAHNLVFALQHRLMACNPRRPGVGARFRVHSEVPGVRPIRPGVAWKLLSLPDDPGAGREAAWQEAVAATLDRAFDRWAYAQHHAQRAARRGQDPEAAVIVARIAWNNYWDLLQDAERIRRAAATTART